MRAPLAALRKPAGFQNKPPSVLYAFEHKMLFFLIHAPYTCTVAFNMLVI